MTQAPSIKEALANLQAWCDEQGSKLGAVDGYDYHSGEEAAYRHVAIEIKKRLAALATFQPDGERREAIARALDEVSVGTEHSTVYCKGVGEIPIIRLDAESRARVVDAIALASGLVQNEAGEPTTAMVDAGVAFALNVSLSGEYRWSQYVADLYKTMRAAAIRSRPRRGC